MNSVRKLSIKFQYLQRKCNSALTYRKVQLPSFPSSCERTICHFGYKQAHKQNSYLMRHKLCDEKTNLFKNLSSTSIVLPPHSSIFSCYKSRFVHISNRHCHVIEDQNTNKVSPSNEESNPTSTYSNSINTPTLLETWFYEVSPYGSLNAHLPFNTVIKPLNPQDYPDINKCIIEVHYDNTSDGNTENAKKLPDPHQLSQISDLYTMKVTFDKDKANMNIDCNLVEGVSIPVTYYLRVPIKSDISAKVSGKSDVSVEGMECDTISLEADQGDIYLKKNKSLSVIASSKSGNIVSKSTQLGNLDLQCGHTGSISTDKLQGSSISCSTELGSVSIKSLYTENATFKTITGDIGLGHCHGKICVVGEKSNLKIESLDGDLDVALQQGSVDAHLSRHQKVDIDMNTGDIKLSFTENIASDLNLSSSSLTVTDELNLHMEQATSPFHKEGYIGKKGAAEVNARTLSGVIALSVLDWIQTTKLAFMVDNDDK